MAGRLEGRVALITGASRGLGASMAVALAKEGAHVIATARTEGGLTELDDQIKAVGGSATLVPLDIKDYAGIDRLGAAIYERWKKLDILVGNAGILGKLTPMAHVEPKGWDDVMAVNVTANYRLIRSLDVLLRQSDAGRAVFMTSGLAHKCWAYWGPYSISKAALEAMVKTYAAENATTAIRANCFSPGATRTRMRAQAMRQVLDGLQHVHVLGVEHLGCTQGLGFGQTLRTHIQGNDARAHGGGQLGGGQSHGSLPKHHQGLVARQFQALEGAPGRTRATGNGGPRGKRKLVSQGHQRSCRHLDVIGMTAVAGDAIDFSHTFDAQLHPARGAVRAAAASTVMMNHGALPQPGLFGIDVAAHCHHHPAGLMTRDFGFRVAQAQGALRLAGRWSIKLQVTAAHARGFHL